VDGVPTIRHQNTYSENEEEILANLTRIKGVKSISKYVISRLLRFSRTRVNFFLVTSHKEGFRTFVECQVLYDRYPELATVTITKQNVTWRKGKISIKGIQ
jgi:hypothetical protein